MRFAQDVPDRAPQYSSKEYVFRCRMSRLDKVSLYSQRPDLDMSRPLGFEDRIEHELQQVPCLPFSLVAKAATDSRSIPSLVPFFLRFFDWGAGHGGARVRRHAPA